MAFVIQLGMMPVTVESGCIHVWTVIKVNIKIRLMLFKEIMAVIATDLPEKIGIWRKSVSTDTYIIAYTSYPSE